MKKEISYVLFITLLLSMLSGCAGMMPANENAKSEITFDYQIPGKSKDVLWKNARDYFAGAYGDSRSVFRVMDQEDGTIIGKGTASWMLLTNQCSTDYHIRFAAKDNKARLQFEIIRGVPAFSACQGWPWPSESGYQSIISSFEQISVELDKALRGLGDASRLKDF